MDGGATLNLIIVHTPGLQARSDFETVADNMARLAPDIEVLIIANNARHSVVKRQAAGRPTLVFSPAPIREFAPRRGRVFSGRSAGKGEEIRLLAAAGLPTPRTVAITPDTVLDPAEWGSVVIVKPEFGMRGEMVRLMSTDRVRWVDPMSFPQGDIRRGQTLHAQQYIDPGRYPKSYRVMTVFGRPVYSMSTTALDPTPAIDPAKPVNQWAASNAGRRKIALNFEQDVLDLGARTYAAFPEAPVHGVDIIREEATGNLYVLELNPGGFAWHISSDYGVGHQREHGVDYMAQFGALDIITDALIDATRRWAE